MIFLYIILSVYYFFGILYYLNINNKYRRKQAYREKIKGKILHKSSMNAQMKERLINNEQITESLIV